MLVVAFLESEPLSLASTNLEANSVTESSIMGPWSPKLCLEECFSEAVIRVIQYS